MPYGFGPNDPMNFSSFNVLGGAPDFSGAGPIASASGIGDQVAAYGAPNIGAPTMGGAGGGFLGGFGMPEAQAALGGLETIGKLWGAWQSAKLAKKQFNFTKDVTNTNLANQIRAYNTQLEDRSRSRAVVEGQSAAQAQDYIDRNKAVRG